VLHVGSTQVYTKIAHHNLHFGRAWSGAFDDITRHGRFMRDPSLLVCNPSRTDPSLAPPGQQTYYVLAPVPNLDIGPTLSAWRRRGLAQRYADEVVATLEARGYVGFGSAVRTKLVASPANWAALGLAAGTPFAPAHLARQTGPFRPGNLHPGLDNVVFVGAGTRPGVGVPMVLISGKLAAQRVVGS
jgi:phytoene desaturase